MLQAPERSPSAREPAFETAPQATQMKLRGVPVCDYSNRVASEHGPVEVSRDICRPLKKLKKPSSMHNRPANDHQSRPEVWQVSLTNHIFFSGVWLQAAFQDCHISVDLASHKQPTFCLRSGRQRVHISPGNTAINYHPGPPSPFLVDKSDTSEQHLSIRRPCRKDLCRRPLVPASG